MDRLREMEVFVAVADAGSFARAGTRMRISPPAVTRVISALETRLGARLFNRTTRSLSLTEVGARFLERARRLLAEIDAAEREAVGETAVPQGHLTVTAPVMFGRMILAPLICEVLDAQPRLTASLILLDRIVNLVEEGIDMAVRIGPLPDSTLVARRLGEVHRLLVASPAYLARHGRPEVPTDLKLHPVIGFTGLMRRGEWRYTGAGGANHVALTPRLEVNDASVAIAAAERGFGITMTLSYMVADALRGGRLVPVLDAFAPPPAPVQLVYPQSRLIAPKIRAFVDAVSPALRATLGSLAVDPGDASAPGRRGPPARLPGAADP